MQHVPLLQALVPLGPASVDLDALEADILLFAKNVDGVYDSDPKTNPNAKKIDEIKCQDIIRQGLRVVDTSAASLCYEQKIPVLIFGLNEENSLMRAVKGEKIGTVVTVG